ncbi:hypothetical protein N7490_000744 [Penicillium lividum]|nr:hypothetical protein N7490_000744 [Penicillium lividum]
MVTLVLVPYNESMALGQGYNSFLQEPRMHHAVTFQAEPSANETGRNTGLGASRNVSQVVNYASCFTDKISDIAQSMNVAPASAINNENIRVSGKSLPVDESKFASADVNVMVSVKVVNQTTILPNSMRFLGNSNRDACPMNEWTSKEFHDIYGDCFISGFIEGGELHGVVSVRALNRGESGSIEAVLKSALNSASSPDEFAYTPESASTLEKALGRSETTINVHWMGGGQIKDEQDEWTLIELFKAAAAFPARVSRISQRTHAILTRYDTNPGFLQWAKEKNISLKSYGLAQVHARDLMDKYFGVKKNLTRVESALSNPSQYEPSRKEGAVKLDTDSLVQERQKLKQEVAKIVDQVNAIDSSPEAATLFTEPKFTIEEPELWATRLPVTSSSDAIVVPIQDDGPSKAELQRQKEVLENKLQERVKAAEQAQADLTSAQGELTAIQTESSNTTARFRQQADQFGVQISVLEGEKQQKQGEIEGLQQQLKSEQDKSATSQGVAQQKQTEIENLRQQLKNERDKIVTSQGVEQQKQREIDSLQKQVREEANKALVAQGELASLKSYLGYADTHPRGYIHSIFWGGQDFSNRPELREKLYQYLDNKQSFWITTDLIGLTEAELEADSLELFENGFQAMGMRKQLRKVLHVVYSFKEASGGNHRIRILAGLQGHQGSAVKFDAYNAE